MEYSGAGRIPSRGLYDTISDWEVRARFANGVALHFLNANAAEPIVKAYRPWSQHGTTFFGSKGWVSVDRGGLHAGDPAILGRAPGGGDRRLYESGGQQQNFVDCIKSRGETVSPFESAFQSYVVSHMSDLCIRLGRRLAWDPEKEIVIGNAEATARLHREPRLPWKLEEIGIK